MSIELQLRHRREAADADADDGVWFLPGATAADWLAELVQFGVPLPSVLLLSVPMSRTDRRPLGAIALLPTARVPQRIGRAQRWRKRGDCVLLPADAELWPPVADSELQALVTARWWVWHPTAGPVAYAEHDLLTAAALVRTDRCEVAFDRARAGTAVVARLTDVRAAVEPTVATVFAVDREQIGTQRPSELLPLPGERRLPVVRPLLARLLLWLMTDPAATRTATGWQRRVIDWASSQLAGRSARKTEVDQSRRDREVGRLLALLQSDPQRGLRYALPLGGAAGRGVAPPSNELVARGLQLQIGALGGGGAIDAWTLDANLRWQLEQRYRELARAAAAAGQYRRAAYVWAHLVGDLHAAATVLRDGGEFREAALLFRRRQDFDAATRCLVLGGWLAEAADLEVELQRFERAGDLRLLLGQDEAAARLHNQAHAQLLAQGLWLPAGLLQAEKLRDVDGALRAFAARRVEDADPRAFAAWLALLLRTRDEVTAAELLRQSTIAPHEVEVVTTFAKRLAAGPVLAVLRDLVRRGAAARLLGADDAERRHWFAAMLHTQPLDRVLPHDVRQADRRLRPERTAGRTPAGITRRWQMVGEFAPPGQIVVSGDWLLQLQSVPAPRLARRRIGERSARAWDWMALPLSMAIAVLPLRDRPGVLVIGVGEQSFRWLRLSTSSWPPTIEVVDVARTEDPTLGVAVDDDGSVWNVSAAFGLVRRMFGGDPARQSGQVRSGAQGGVLCVVQGVAVSALGNEAVVGNATSTLPSAVRELVRAEEPGNSWLAFALDRGVAVLDVRGAAGQQLFSAGDQEAPTVGWTRNGILVAVDDQEACCYRPGADGLRLLCRQPHRSGKPRQILPTAAPNEVMLLAAQTITCFEVR